MTIEDLEWVMGINFWGVVYGVKAFLPKSDRVGRRAPREHVERVRADRDPVPVGLQRLEVRGPRLHRGTAAGAARRRAPGRRQLRAPGWSQDRDRARMHGPTVRTRTSSPARSSGSPVRVPEQAARTILEGVRRDRAQILVGTDARLLDVGQRLLGPTYQQISYRLSKLLDGELGVTPDASSPLGPDGSDRHSDKIGRHARPSAQDRDRHHAGAGIAEFRLLTSAEAALESRDPGGRSSRSPTRSS